MQEHKPRKHEYQSQSQEQHTNPKIKNNKKNNPNFDHWRTKKQIYMI